MKKIALFMLAPLTDGGGAEKYFVSLARNFRQRDIETDIITMDKAFIERFAKWLYLFYYGRWFRQIDTSGRESESSIEEQLGKARWIRVSYKNLEKTLRSYDVIYSKNELVDLALLKRMGYKKLPPVIVGMHTPIYYPEANSFFARLHNFLYSSIFYKWLLRGTKCIHVSNSSAKELVEKKFRIKCALIYYPFSIEEISELAQKNKSDIIFDGSKKNIIFVGRLSKQKGVDTLINIIAKVSKNENLNERIYLNIFGRGEKKYEDKLKTLSEKYSFIRYFGHIENKFIPDILNKQDLMIAPSKWETLPYSILEAQAMGVPVIAFDIPGPSDIIIDNKTGLLVSNENNYLSGIKVVVKSDIQFLKDEIIKNIEEKFAPEKIYPELIDMFKEYSESEHRKT